MRINDVIIILFIAVTLTVCMQWAYTCKALDMNSVSEDTTTIQEAIDAASPGDTIHVSAGVYPEHLKIDKPITLIGDNQSTTILDGNGTGILIDISSDNVSLSGFKLRNAETAIVMINVKNCQIKGNTILDFSVFNGRGICAYNSKNITIEENVVRDIYWFHVYFNGTKESRITKNVFVATSRWSQPILLVYSNQNVISWNQALGQGVENEGGIGLISSNHNFIMYNNIVANDWAGISLRKSNYTIIEGNTIASQSFWGLVMKYCENNSIHRNNFIANYEHVSLDSVRNLNWSAGNYGNYWDDYAGKDFDQDGIGNSPYVIDIENNDSRPLMGMFYCYEVYKDDEKIQIITISNSTFNDLRYLANADSSDGALELNVSGIQGTRGFCLVIFPKSLVELPYNVTVSGTPPLLLKDLSDNQLAALYIVYIHQNPDDTIFIVPEFSSAVAILIMLGLSALTLLILKHRHKDQEFL